MDRWCSCATAFQNPGIPGAISWARSPLLVIIPQIRLIVLAAIVDAKNVHGVVCHLERDRRAPAVSDRPQARPNVAALRASMREGREGEAIFDDGRRVSLPDRRR